MENFVDSRLQRLREATHDHQAADTIAAELTRLRAIAEQLRPLCMCDTGPDTDGPEQDCPLHGDGVTFVADVRWLQAIEHAARAFVSAEGLRMGVGTQAERAYDKFQDLLRGAGY